MCLLNMGWAFGYGKNRARFWVKCRPSLGEIVLEFIETHHAEQPLIDRDINSIIDTYDYDLSDDKEAEINLILAEYGFYAPERLERLENYGKYALRKRKSMPMGWPWTVRSLTHI